MTQRQAILRCLSSEPIRVREIRARTGIGEDVIRARLAELRNRGRVVSYSLRLPRCPSGKAATRSKWRQRLSRGRPAKYYRLTDHPKMKERK